MPKHWKVSTLIPIYKGKGNGIDCGSYRRVKLLEHKNGGKNSGEMVKKYHQVNQDSNQIGTS